MGIAANYDTRARSNDEGDVFCLIQAIRRQGNWVISPAMLGGAVLLVDGLRPAYDVPESHNRSKLRVPFRMLADMWYVCPQKRKNKMAKTRLTINNNGSVKIEGDFEIVDRNGDAYGLQGRTVVSICRCGLSKNKPFCDGSHRGHFEHDAVAFDLPPKKA